MRIHVLGCGPSGLLVAHAGVQAGHDVTIYSQKKKSHIGGAQFLHTAIPDLTDDNPEDVVTFEYRGTAEGYAQKVYGSPKADTSWDTYAGTVPIWNMRRAYDDLWKRYESLIIDRSLTPHEVAELQDSVSTVISTIPRKALCMRDHRFTSQQVHIWYELGALKDNRIIYNGIPDVPWYRASNLFSWESVEYPSLAPHGSNTRAVYKPLETDCDCLPEIVKLGRYGRWEKGVLIHHAYWGAVRQISRAEQGYAHDAM